MNRRKTDEIEARIQSWERLRAELGPDAPHAVVGYVNAEIDRLRFNKLVRSRPVPGGRRDEDPEPSSPAPPMR